MKELDKEEIEQVSGGAQESCGKDDPPPYGGGYRCPNAAKMPFFTLLC